MKYTLTNDFEIIDLGIQEVDVYDIEVDETHNFFGNDICLHNSVYIEIEDIVKQRWSHLTDVQEIATKIDEYAKSTVEPYINKVYTELADYMNAKENLLDMKREAIADVFIIRAKKNYAMRVIDNEGVRYAKPKPKIMGLEPVRTTHPMMVRKFLAHCIDIIFDGEVSTLREEVLDFKELFMTTDLINIASPKRLSSIKKYSTSNHTPRKGIVIPIHATASINYNALVSKHKLSNRHPYITGGDNMRFLPLKEPNPIDSHVIGFIDELPKEFGLDEFIDKETQYQKIFISPLESLIVFNNWTLEENSLLDAFGSDIDIAKVATIKNVKKAKKEKIEVESFF